MEAYYKTDLGTIYHGDCCKILPTLGHFNILFTDIPFGVDLKYAEYKDERKIEIYKENCNDWFRAFKGAADLYIVKAPTKNMHIVLPAFAEHLPYTWTIIQHSPNATTHSPFNLSLYTQYLIAIEGKLKKRPNCDVFKNTRNNLKTDHPAEMPTQPVKELLLMFGADEETTVVDPFLGSGTTAEACEKFGIPWVGIEMTEEYCEMAKKRTKLIDDVHDILTIKRSKEEIKMDQGTLF